MTLSVREPGDLYPMAFDTESMREARRLLSWYDERDLSRLDDHGVLELLRVRPHLLRKCRGRFNRPQDAGGAG